MSTQKLFSFAIVLIFLNSTPFRSIAQDSKTETIQWITFEEALSKSKTTPKKIFMDVYTEWCGWCKKMDASTFKDPKVVSYINANFYAVKLDAETKDTISYKEKKYTFVPAYKSNEIAAYLLNGQMGYPTSVYLDEKSDPITSVPGYYTSEQLLPILKYFAEDIYKTKKWEEYQGSGTK